MSRALDFLATLAILGLLAGGGAVMGLYLTEGPAPAEASR